MEPLPTGLAAGADLDDAVDHDIDLGVDLDRLRARRSAKWREHPPDVLPAWVAESDFPLAEPVRAVLHAAVERGDTGYAHPRTADLGAAYAGFAARRFGWDVDPEQVWLVADVNVAIAEVLRLLTEPGDAVVVDTPAYPPFFHTIPGIGRRLVATPLLRTGDGWRLDLGAIGRAFAAGARGYLLCSPHNPTGMVPTRAELAEVAALAERHGVAVVSDEIHAPLTLPGATHAPYVGLGGYAAERGVTLTAASKAFNIAGLKCALAVTASEHMRTVLAGLPPETPVGASILGALATEAALRDGDAWLDAVLRRLDANRRLLADLLADRLPQVRYCPPRASYLAWLDCRRLAALRDVEDPAATFLERGRVALSPGPAFGPQGTGFVRLNIGTSPALLAEAVRRMAAAVDR